MGQVMGSTKLRMDSKQKEKVGKTESVVQRN
jgi:hypothetical protein